MPKTISTETVLCEAHYGVHPLGPGCAWPHYVRVPGSDPAARYVDEWVGR